MKKVLLLASAAILFAGVSFANTDKSKKKKCAKGKACCTKSTASGKAACCKDKTAKI
jgi:hypothetical protein